MTDWERFERNACSRGVLIDTNLLVLLVVGFVNLDRIRHFKRTCNFHSEDWELLTKILERLPLRFTSAHILAEVSNLTDLGGFEQEDARDVLHHAISLMVELPASSLEACRSRYYRRLGLTDAVIVSIANQRGCPVLTSDSGLYLALSEQSASVVNFDDLRKLL